jgi:DNA-directed RNA polymerase subunit M/transcription elongation factor TFIIS
MPNLSTVLLSIKGEARKTNLVLSQENELNIEILQKYFKKKETPELIASYEYDNKVLFIFGYKKGKKGTENKTELPEPYSETPFFGDAIVLVSINNKWSTPIPFTLEQWMTFVNGTHKDEVENEVEDEEDEEEQEEELEEQEEEGEPDDFEEDDLEKTSIIDEEEIEETPILVKKKKLPVYTKVDPNSIKEEINIQSEPETNKLRTLCLNNLNFLEKHFSKDDIRSLERSIFEVAYNYAQTNYIPRSWKSQQFQEVYRQIVRAVFSNLHPESPVKNSRLINRVIEGEFTLSSIPSMSAYEMFPENWFALKDKLLQREQKILEGNKSRATDQFKCRRCQKRECTYYELQTRSADEPMTIFITCLNCGKEWRQGG